MSIPDKEKLKKRMLKLTKEALEAGATVADVQRQIAPLVSASTFHQWAQKWKQEGLL